MDELIVAFAEEVLNKQWVPGWGPMGSVMVLNGQFCCFVEAVRLFCNGVRVGSCGLLQCTLAFRLRGAEQNASFRLGGVEKTTGSRMGSGGVRDGVEWSFLLIC